MSDSLKLTEEQHDLIKKILEAGDRCQQLAGKCQAKGLTILAKWLLSVSTESRQQVDLQCRAFRDASLTQPIQTKLDM